MSDRNIERRLMVAEGLLKQALLHEYEPQAGWTDAVMKFLTAPTPPRDPVEVILAVKCPIHEHANPGIGCGSAWADDGSVETYCASRIRSALGKPR